MSGERCALLIACDLFDDKRYKPLDAPLLDAEALKRVLEKPEIGAFKVDIILNESHNVVKDRIDDFFSNRHPNDVLLLYFAGHGALDERRTFYFVCRDTRSSKLNISGVSHQFVHETMVKSASRSQILIIDCCYSGAFAKNLVMRGRASVDIKHKLSGEGRVVLTASDALEYAYERKNDCGEVISVFSSRIVEGLETGEADIDGDGFIMVNELYDYVSERIRREDPAQKPLNYSFVRGNLWIGRATPRKDSIPREILELLRHEEERNRRLGIIGLKDFIAERGSVVRSAALSHLEILLKDKASNIRTLATNLISEIQVERAREDARRDAKQEAERVTAEATRSRAAEARALAEKNREEFEKGAWANSQEQPGSLNVDPLPSRSRLIIGILVCSMLIAAFVLSSKMRQSFPNNASLVSAPLSKTKIPDNVEPVKQGGVLPTEKPNVVDHSETSSIVEKFLPSRTDGVYDSGQQQTASIRIPELSSPEPKPPTSETDQMSPALNPSRVDLQHSTPKPDPSTPEINPPIPQPKPPTVRPSSSKTSPKDSNLPARNPGAKPDRRSVLEKELDRMYDTFRKK